MDNQHKKIKGYRDLSQQEIDLMNEIKNTGEQLKELVRKLKLEAAIDQRWVAIGNTNLQVGIMELVRAVAQPESF